MSQASSRETLELSTSKDKGEREDKDFPRNDEGNDTTQDEDNQTTKQGARKVWDTTQKVKEEFIRFFTLMVEINEENMEFRALDIGLNRKKKHISGKSVQMFAGSSSCLTI